MPRACFFTLCRWAAQIAAGSVTMVSTDRMWIGDSQPSKMVRMKNELMPGFDKAFAGLIEDLHERVRRGAYRAQPSRRRYIPKPDGRQRPLAVTALSASTCDGGVAWETWHAYPQAGELVYTKSVVSPR